MPERNFNGSVYCAYNDTVYEILYEFASHLAERGFWDVRGFEFRVLRLNLATPGKFWV